MKEKKNRNYWYNLEVRVEHVRRNESKFGMFIN